MFASQIAEYCELQRMRAEIKADIAKSHFELNALKHEIEMVVKRINQIKKDMPCDSESDMDEVKKILIKNGWQLPKAPEDKSFRCPRMDPKVI